MGLPLLTPNPTTTADTPPTSLTPHTTLNTKTFSTTTLDPERQTEERSSDGSFLLLLSEEEPLHSSCKSKPEETRRSLLSPRPKEPWHKRCNALQSFEDSAKNSFLYLCAYIGRYLLYHT